MTRVNVNDDAVVLHFVATETVTIASGGSQAPAAKPDSQAVVPKPDSQAVVPKSDPQAPVPKAIYSYKDLKIIFLDGKVSNVQ